MERRFRAADYSRSHRWRAYDPETGTHLATGHYPDEPPEGARVVEDEPEEVDDGEE